ncbi:MAG: fimbrial protein FimV [Polaromonas sp.]|nr:fimbrial protein FimV [Polaromonas sp.]
MNHRSRWHIGALASAIALLGSLASLQAHALALGRITVQSALGEPLRAEIDIADITADEASSLKAGVAPAETFKAAGLEYSTVAAGLEVQLQRRADGRSYLRLSSNRPVTEPFVDLILQAHWSTGRITRDYTMLFDPPNLRSGSADVAVAPTAPILSRPAAPSAVPPARAMTPTPYSPPRPPAARPAPVAKAPVAQASPAEKAPASNKQLTVKTGDTAGRIAAQNKPASVSLDQMLVALLRSNPDAFIGGNVNLIKSGAVLEIPRAEAAGAISAGEATRTIVAQSKDFNAFRRKLAESVPSTQVASADRQAGGNVEAKVEDRALANAMADKLTLSKGAIQGKTATIAEDKIAKDRQAQEASTRMAELSKNISDLNKLSAVSAVPAAAPEAVAAKTPSLAVPVSAPSAVASSAQVNTSADTAAAGAAAVADKKPVVIAPPPPAEPSLIDNLLDNPLILPLAGGLLALLAALGFYRYRQRKTTSQMDSSFLESRLRPDSFFGASGGQRIDTNESNAMGSSLVYSPSQLDAAGDVDPVAEADVYLAYGRDLQAEEILKEALRTSPKRVAVHAKLLEIYAKRHDKKAFDGMAIVAFNLTNGYGPEWAYISEMGRELDPANPMYQASGPAADRPAGDAAAVTLSGTMAQGAQEPPPAQAPVAAPGPDIDLALDFSLDDEPKAATSLATIAAVAPAAPPLAFVEPSFAMEPIPSPDDLDTDFDRATVTLPLASSPAPASRPDDVSAPEITFPADGLDFTTEPFAAPEPLPSSKTAATPAPATANSGMLEFDLDSLSLDLSEPTTESPAQAVTASSIDPLETKFLLAEEFSSLGDADGARALADEVLAKASGPLKVKVQAFLNALS